MFSLKIEMPYDIVGHSIRPQTIKNRIAIMRDVYTKVHSIHIEEYEHMEALDKQECERTKNHDTDEFHDYSYSEKLQELEFLFYRMHRASTIMMIYSFLEHTMMRICSMYEQKLEVPISVGELSGSGIHRCKTFLSKFAGLKFNSQDMKGDWDFLSMLNKLRNSIAHEEGYISEQSRISKKTINGTKGLSMYSNTILLSHEYVLDAFDITESVIIKLCAQKNIINV